MLKPISIAALLLTALVLPFSSCKKGQLEDIKTNVQALKAQAEAEQSLAVIVEIIQEEVAQLQALNTGLSAIPAGQCPVVTLSTGGFPAMLKIDFGIGCTTKKGHSMAGTIQALVSGKTDSTGAIINITLTGISVDGNELNGALTLQTTGANGAAQQDLALTLKNVVIKSAEGNTVTIENLEGTRKQVAGKDTTPKTGGLLSLKDDVFEIIFSGNGTDAEGNPYTLSTTTPLRREYDCRYIVSGKIEYKVAPVDKSADYGDGSCDNQLVVQIGTVTKIVTIP
jgi:hypothetical protein